MQVTTALARAPESDGVCRVAYIDEPRVSAVLEAIPPPDSLSRAVKLFAALAGRTRLLILFALMKQRELCVCDLAAITGRTLAGTSHQLQKLRGLGLVTFRMQGKLAYYRVTSDVAQELVLRLVGPMRGRKGRAR